MNISFTNIQHFAQCINILNSNSTFFTLVQHFSHLFNIFQTVSTFCALVEHFYWTFQCSGSRNNNYTNTGIFNNEKIDYKRLLICSTYDSRTSSICIRKTIIVFNILIFWFNNQHFLEHLVRTNMTMAFSQEWVKTA